MTLRVVVAVPFPDRDVALLADREPRLEIVHRPDLFPGATDWLEPYERTEEQQAEFESILDSADALLGAPDQSGRALGRTVQANPALRWVHTIPAGGGAQVRAARLGQADLDRVLFTTSAGVHAAPLAEFAVLGVLAGAKRLPRLESMRQRREWEGHWSMGQVSGSTVVVVGLGHIGRAVARTLAALGATVVGVHRRDVDVSGVTRILGVDRLGEALAEADAVVMTLPRTDATHHMLSGEVLNRARPGITVVNVGRGTTIDEAALVAALHDGRVGFAALDVFEKEPLEASSAIWDAPNVLLSPHTAAVVPGQPRAIAELFATNATKLLDDEPLENRVNTVEFY